MDLKTFFSKIADLYNNINDDYLGLVAAGVAFYFLLAAFPALTAVISLYGIFADPHFITDQINLLARFLPGEALDIFASQARNLVESNQKALGVSFVISTLFAIYSATRGVGALIQGLNIAFNRKETRNFIKLTTTGYMLTFVIMAYVLIALTLIAGLPAILKFFAIHETQKIYLLLRWPLLFFTGLLGVQTLYSYGPSHGQVKWQWMSLGSFAATILWLSISSCFSLFVTHFGNYNETYGSISAIIILLLWLWLSALAILTGAEINTVFSKTVSDKRRNSKIEDNLKKS